MTSYVTDICHQCGNLRSVCSDEARSGEWYPQRSICYAIAAKEAAWRKVRAHHKDPDAKSSDPHILDGWSIWASKYDLTPDDDFEGALRLLGSPAANGQANDEQ